MLRPKYIKYFVHGCAKKLLSGEEKSSAQIQSAQVAMSGWCLRKQSIFMHNAVYFSSRIRVQIIQSKQVDAAEVCLCYEGHLLLEGMPQEGDVLLPLLREPNVGGHV